MADCPHRAFNPGKLKEGRERMKLQQAFRARFLDVLASIYIYNEHRGYTSLDRVLEAVRARCSDDPAFIAEVEQHRADEHKHYRMFRRWYELQGRMPLKVDRTCGHIDHFIQAMFRCTIDDLDTQAIVADRVAFEQLCRVIMLTEQRGRTPQLTPEVASAPQPA